MYPSSSHKIHLLIHLWLHGYKNHHIVAIYVPQMTGSLGYVHCLLVSLCLALNSRIFNNFRTVSLPTTSRWSLTNCKVICLYPILLTLPLNSYSTARTTSIKSLEFLPRPSPLAFKILFNWLRLKLIP